MAIFDAKELGAYIQSEFQKKYNKNISPVRLQKSLYFCLAFWGGFIRKGKLSSDKEMDYSNEYDEALFNNEIQAWVYGPVVVDVYNEQNLKRFYNENMFNGKDFLKDFVDDILKDINELSDFRLVDISRLDNSWNKHFDYDFEDHKQIITQEEIIDEYSRK